MNISDIAHVMPDKLACDDVVIRIYLEKGGFLVNGVIDVELNTFLGYTQYIYISLLLEPSRTEHINLTWTRGISYDRDLLDPCLTFPIGIV